ncbi:glucan biosynthesis protein [Lichenihabitans psoromatis]|uniref:glucan biosynthesis protein n=1 Tax=Lichenihabitans psoromatis TaxID=2528642 RepID=UPI001035898D|nr:glucan biosynthesis protein G [Lichenihabitans psoromatis]
MQDLNRRRVVSGLAAGAALGLAPRAFAQTAPGQPVPKFGFEDVLKRARELGTAPFEATPPALPDSIARLDFDAWRDIRFRPDRALLGQDGSPFRLEMFHLGHLYPRPVTVNIVHEGIATPVPYSTGLFDYGRNKIDKPLPVNLGFAGFRLHYPLNRPDVMDEVIAFLGASYFRFLGRNQHYGMSARGLTVNAGTDNEAFPFFREFWIEAPAPGATRVTIYALLDGDAVTGAFRFDLYPGNETVVDVDMTLFPRRSGAKIGIAALTSMFFTSQNDRRFSGDFRPELHDSDGLLLHSGTGEWIWRPLRNPAMTEVSAFLDSNTAGFGLLQRDRSFEDYQDLDLNYELRPSYWVEPRGTWGEGRVELVELPTSDETNDNIVAAWTAHDPIEQGKSVSYAYSITSSLNLTRLSPGGRVSKTFQTQARSLGSNEVVAPGSRRFLIDFSGGDLSYFSADPSLVSVVPTSTSGKITRSFLVPNPHIGGFRAAIDVALDPNQSTDLRAFLKAGDRALTETWTFPWKAV